MAGNSALTPNALIFGERYLMHDHPQVVWRLQYRYIDVLSIQPGNDLFEEEYFDALYASYGKPIIICDHQCAFLRQSIARQCGSN